MQTKQLLNCPAVEIPVHIQDIPELAKRMAPGAVSAQIRLVPLYENEAIGLLNSVHSSRLHFFGGVHFSLQLG